MTVCIICTAHSVHIRRSITWALLLASKVSFFLVTIEIIKLESEMYIPAVVNPWASGGALILLYKEGVGRGANL
jgi:hypothetical protein